MNPRMKSLSCQSRNRTNAACRCGAGEAAFQRGATSTATPPGILVRNAGLIFPETNCEITVVREWGKRGAKKWHGGADSGWLQSAVTTSEEQQSRSGSLHLAIDYRGEHHPLFLRALAAPVNAWLKKNWLTNLFSSYCNTANPPGTSVKQSISVNLCEGILRLCLKQDIILKNIFPPWTN